MSTLSAPARSRSRPRTAAERRSLVGLLRGLAVALATVLVLLALAVVPLVTPAWIHGAMLAVGATADGASAAESLALSDATVHQLIFGPATFDISYAGGRPLYGAAEIGHLQDVRLVLYALLAGALIGVLVIAWALARGPRAAAWRAIGRGALGLALVVGGLAVFAALAFGVVFELFHRLLFPGGNWAFDPAQSNLVRLYPVAFWQLSAAAYGGLLISSALAVWLVGRRLAGRAG